MKLLAWVFFFVLPLAADADERILLVVGDSLSAAYEIDPDAGWVTLLQRRLDARSSGWRVVNASISGDTTAGGLARMPGLLQQHRPALVLIELGSNDGLRGFAFDTIKANIGAMVELSLNAGARVLLIGGRLPPNYGAAYADAFQALFGAIAAEKGLPLVPFLLDGVAQDRALMLEDGYHPAARAQQRLLDNVWQVLGPALEAFPAGA